MRTDHKSRITLNPNLDHTLTGGEDLKRGKHYASGLYPSTTGAVDVLSGTLKPSTFKVEIKSKHFFSLHGLIVPPSLLHKRRFLSRPCWYRPGKATSMMLMRFGLPKVAALSSTFGCRWKSPCVSLVVLQMSVISL